MLTVSGDFMVSKCCVLMSNLLLVGDIVVDDRVVFDLSVAVQKGLILGGMGVLHGGNLVGIGLVLKSDGLVVQGRV